MHAIDGVNLVELTDQSLADLIAEKRKSASNKIKQIFQKKEQLHLDISTLEKQLEGKRNELKKHDDKITKLKAGDWSVLEDDKPKKDGEEKGLPSIEHQKHMGA